MDTLQTTENAVVRDITLALGKPISTGEGSYALLPEGVQLEDLERFDYSPRRIKQHVRPSTPGAFGAYFDRYQTDETVVFVDADLLEITAIFDYHTPQAEEGHGPSASWCSHQATLSLKLTDELEAWSRQSGVMSAQLTFAAFIEDHIEDVPEGATLLQAARQFQATRNSSFASMHDDHSGSVTFEVKHDTRPTSKITLPETFSIAVPVFRGMEKWELNARLRYRITDEGALSIGYKLQNLQPVRQAAFEDILGVVQEGRGLDGKSGGMVVIEGKPC